MVVIVQAVVQDQAPLNGEVQIAGGGRQPAGERTVMLHVKANVLAEASFHDVVDSIEESVLGVLFIGCGCLVLQKGKVH